MAVIAQRQRLREVLGHGLKTPEMRDPFLVAEGIEPDSLRRALIAIAQDVIGKRGRRDDVVELGTERGPWLVEARYAGEEGHQKSGLPCGRLQNGR